MSLTWTEKQKKKKTWKGAQRLERKRASHVVWFLKQSRVCKCYLGVWAIQEWQCCACVCIFMYVCDWACIWVKSKGHGGRDEKLGARCAGRRCLLLWVITWVSRRNEPTAFHTGTPCLLLSDTSVIDGPNFPPASWFDHTAMGPI